MSDVLIVNLWYHDIGRHNASNYGLLKTIFEVNFKLFHYQQNKRTLVFVVRDSEDISFEKKLIN